MGRSINSFTSWVGHAAEISEGEVTLPEKDLWVAVLCRAVLDACKGPPDLDMTRKANISHKSHYKYNRDAAPKHDFGRTATTRRLVHRKNTILCDVRN